MSNVLLYAINELNLVGNALANGVPHEEAVPRFMECLTDTLNGITKRKSKVFSTKNKPTTVVILNGGTMPVLGELQELTWRALLEALSYEVDVVIVNLGLREFEELGDRRSLDVVDALMAYASGLPNVIVGNSLVEIDDFLLYTVNIMDARHNISPNWLERHLCYNQLEAIFSDGAWENNKAVLLSALAYETLQSPLTAQAQEAFNSYTPLIESSKGKTVICVSSVGWSKVGVEAVAKKADYIITPNLTTINPCKKEAEVYEHDLIKKFDVANTATFLLEGSKEDTKGQFLCLV
jgi:hypothetical protein